jgi:hypothetical protein
VFIFDQTPRAVSSMLRAADELTPHKSVMSRFAKYLVDPAHIEAMRSAFHKVCRVLQLRYDADDPVTDLIVTKIIEHAKAGELDPDLLCSQVLLDVATRPASGAA